MIPYCLFSLAQAMWKSSPSVRGHLVTLIEVGRNEITCYPGHGVIFSLIRITSSFSGQSAIKLALNIETTKHNKLSLKM